jgi:hypothetical protein
MKNRIYISGVVTSLIIFTGTIFKVNHFPGAAVLLVLGIAGLILFFLPAALINHYKAEENRQNLSLYIVTYITCFVVFTAMLFKILHWPFSGLLLTIALPIPYLIFLPVFLVVTSKNKNFNINNTVAVLLLLALNSVFSALLSLNVTKERIDESYNLARNYNKLETVIDQIPDFNMKSTVNEKIDVVLKTVKEYQELILKTQGTTRESWSAAPGNLLRPEAASVAGQALEAAGETPVGIQLETDLKSLIREMENTRGYESIVKSAPVIFNFSDPGDENLALTSRNFIDSNLTWSLTYLDALEVNIKMIKISGIMN